MNQCEQPGPEYVVVVNDGDEEIAVAEKLAAHQSARLHRAFSVFLFRRHGDSLETLLQQRHTDKYHCGGLWSNSCCGHPRPGEEIIAAGERRLHEEMGIEASLHRVGKFRYRSELANGLTEHEIDHVLIGRCDATTVAFNDEEVADIDWMTLPLLGARLDGDPDVFTPWLSPAYRLMLEHHDQILALFPREPDFCR